MRIESHQHYFAIMKAKMGEFQAVRDLAEDVKQRTTFVWEVPSLPFNHETSSFGKSVDAHIEAFSKRLHESREDERHCFVDCRQLDRESRLGTGEIPLAAALRLTSDLGAHPSICDEPTTNECEIVREHLANGGELLLRLSERTFANISFRQTLSQLLRRVGATPVQVHLFFDFEQLSNPNTQSQAFAAYSAIANLDNSHEWLSYTIVGGSMPNSLPPAEQSPKLLPRLEWNIWKDVVANLPATARLPCFGDYGVSSYDVTELNPRLITVSANIRYTSTEGFWIFKGRSLSRFSFEQFRSLSKQLVEHTAYSGADFSWGDGYIQQCALGVGGTGNTTTWRRVGTNHHVTLVARQLSGGATFATPTDA